LHPLLILAKQLRAFAVANSAVKSLQVRCMTIALAILT
jgi:hypothetical protein